MKKVLFTLLTMCFSLAAWSDNITFADATVKALCVANWDADSDGELSEEEAAAVTSLGSVFNEYINHDRSQITSFDEFQYFTGIVTIDEYAFYCCSKMTSIIIPNSVKRIMRSAFHNCSKLPSITIPESVTGIWRDAFSGCSSLQSINLPNSITYLERGVFSVCYGLPSIVIPNSVTTIPEDFFNSCYDLKSVIIPEGVTTIGAKAFEYCSSLKSIIIPNSITAIGRGAFDNCSTLNSVTVKNTTPVSIVSETFSNRTSATLYVPAGSKSAYEAATYWQDFKEIVEMPAITFADANVKALCVANWDTNGDGELSEAEAASVTDLGTVFKGNTTITSFDELKYFTGVTTIPAEGFKGCSGLTSISLPASLTSTGNNSFEDCTGLTAVNVTDLDAYCRISFGWYTPLYYAHHLYLNGETVTSVTFPDGITSVSNVVFEGCTDLTSVTIPEGVTSIGVSSFRSCTNLSSVSLPSTLLSIGDDAFRSDASLESITLPANLTTIGSSAFLKCTSLGAIVIPNGVTTIGTSTFHTCSSLTTVTLPAHLESIGDYAFYNCYNLAGISIPNSVSYLGWAAFQNCNRLASANIPTSVTSIRGYTFCGCDDLSSIQIHEGVTSIGDLAFHGCNLTSVVMERNEPVEITENGFSKRTSATLYVPAGSKSVYEAATYWQDFKEIVEMADEVTIGSAGMGTFCSTHALDFSGTDDIKAYIVSAFKPRTGEVILTRITDVPANTGIVVKGNADTYTLPWGPGETIVSNMLVGVTENTVLNKVDGGYTNYILAKKNGNLGFFAVADGSTLSAGKAYLPLPTASLPSSAGARGMMLVFDDETTGIIDVQNNIQNVRGIYNLQGQRVENPRKGLHIVNGKKVMMK